MITFVTGEYPPDVGGVGDYTAALRGALAETGWPSDVITRRQVPRWDARALVWFVRHRLTARVVHVQYQAAAFDLLGDVCLLPALLRSVRPSVRVVTTFHDARLPYLFPRAGRVRLAALRLLARTSHAVIAADAHDLQILNGPPAGRFQVPIGSNVACLPPDGYKRAAFRQSLGLGRDDLAVVYFGMLNASKGLDLLLDTFARVKAGSPGARLLLLGGPVGASDPTDRFTAARIQTRIDAFGNRVLTTGWLPPRELSAFLAAGDVALLPYLDGASARRGSLLACAAHGLPIVSTRPAAPEVAPYLLAAPLDPVALAEAVARAAESRARWQVASQALAARTSWPVIAARHVQIYEQLLYSRP